MKQQQHGRRKKKTNRKEVKVDYRAGKKRYTQISKILLTESGEATMTINC